MQDSEEDRSRALGRVSSLEAELQGLKQGVASLRQQLMLKEEMGEEARQELAEARMRAKEDLQVCACACVHARVCVWGGSPHLVTPHLTNTHYLPCLTDLPVSPSPCLTSPCTLGSSAGCSCHHWYCIMPMCSGGGAPRDLPTCRTSVMPSNQPHVTRLPAGPASCPAISPT